MVVRVQDTIAYPNSYERFTAKSQARRDAIAKSKADKEFFAAESSKLLESADEIERLHASAAEKSRSAMLASHPGEWDNLIWSCCLIPKELCFCTASVVSVRCMAGCYRY